MCLRINKMKTSNQESRHLITSSARSAVGHSMGRWCTKERQFRVLQLMWNLTTQRLRWAVVNAYESPNGNAIVDSSSSSFARVIDIYLARRPQRNGVNIPVTPNHNIRFSFIYNNHIISDNLSDKKKIVSLPLAMPMQEKTQSFVCRSILVWCGGPETQSSCENIFHRFIKYSEHAAAILTNDKVCSLTLCIVLYSWTCTQYTLRAVTAIRWRRDRKWATEMHGACPQPSSIDRWMDR